MSDDVDKGSAAMLGYAERCRLESTRDVVFLFQTPRWIGTGLPLAEDGEYCHDGDGIRLGDIDERRHWTPREGSEYLTNEQLEDMDNSDGIPCSIKVWDTQSVFLTREEAESHGSNYKHRYREGWRVYGVPCNGSMAALIRGT